MILQNFRTEKEILKKVWVFKTNRENFFGTILNRKKIWENCRKSWGLGENSEEIFKIF